MTENRLGVVVTKLPVITPVVVPIPPLAMTLFGPDLLHEYAQLQPHAPLAFTCAPSAGHPGG
jgi:hypothetical protein